MKDIVTGYAFLYGHMREASPLNIGDNIQVGTYVGHEGMTGHATGIHLHLMEQYLGSSDTWVWNLPIADLENPALFLGIPNQLRYFCNLLWITSTTYTSFTKKSKKISVGIICEKNKKKELDKIKNK